MDTEEDRGPMPTAVGLCLLPSVLLHEIFCRLALPEILRLTSVSKAVGSLVSCDEFRHLFGHRCGSGGSWVFIYKKRPPRESVLRGFNDRSGRWFHVPVARILAPAVPPGEDLYLLAASGDILLFASNGLRGLVAVDLAAGAARKLPPCPLGPRGTASWRRSALKLVAGPPGSGEFSFYFAELLLESHVLFQYCSLDNSWQAVEAVAAGASGNAGTRQVEKSKDMVLLNVGSESVVLHAGRSGGEPMLFRPRLDGEAIGSERLRVFGDGNMALIRTAAVDDEGGGGVGCRVRVRVIESVEVWGMSSDGGEWELVSRAPKELVVRMRRPYGVMMGCLEESQGVVRVVVMSNLKGSWDLIWLCYDRVGRDWMWVPVPELETKGLNMAGIAVSSLFAELRPLKTGGRQR